MKDIIVFNDVALSNGNIPGFTQPWAVKTEWVKRYDRVSKEEKDGENLSPSVWTEAGSPTDVEITTLAQAHLLSGYGKPVGGTNGVCARVTSNGGIFVDVQADGSSLRLRIREVIDGEFTTLLSTRWKSWDRRYSDSLIRLRVSVRGMQVKVRAWMDFEPEPQDWQAHAETNIMNSGGVGIAPEGRAVQEYLWLGVDTTGGRAPLGPAGLISESNADFRGIIPLAVSMCWPLYEDGTKINPEAKVLPRNDMTAARPGYRSARARALKIAAAHNNPVPPPGDLPRGYSHCSRFAGTLILNTIDPRMSAELTDWQNQYLEDPRNGWVQVGCGEFYDPSSYKPGDLWITRNPGHVFVWIGEYGGHSDVIAEAAYNGVENPSSYVGTLVRYRLNKTTGLDGSGRPYSAWRFVGRPPNVAHYQSYDELKQVDLHLQTESGIEPFSV